MKLFKRIFSCILALVMALTTLCCLTVSVGAAEYKKVVKSAVNTQYYSMGNDLYVTDNHKVYRITDSNIKNWKKTGKLSKTSVKLPKELSGSDWTYFSDTDFNYSSLCLFRNGDNRIICRYDKDKKALVKVLSTKNYCGISKNGVIDEFIWEKGNGTKNGKLTVNLYSETGVKFKTLTYSSYGGSWWAYMYGSRYSYIITACSKDSVRDLGDSVYDIYKSKLIRIDEKGNEKVIKSFKAAGLNISSGVGDAITFSYFDPPGRYDYIYYSGTNKCVENYSGDKLLDVVYENRAIVGYDTQAGTEYYLSDIKSGKAISGVYKHMSTKDGKIYLVQNNEGKWGYINSKGKELGWFDDATGFSNGYALVIKNGKAYFINEKLKRVSETFKSDSVINEGKLFQYKSGEKWYAVTMK